MATAFQVLQQRAEEAKTEFATEMSKYSEDNLPTAEAQAHLDEIRQAMTTAVKEVQAAQGFLDSKKDLEANGGRPPIHFDDDERRRGPQSSLLVPSLGQRFVENPDYKTWLASQAPTGVIPDGAKGLHSPPLSFKGLSELDRRMDLVTGASTTSGGAFVIPDRYPGLTELGRRPLTIRQIVTNLQTGSDTVEYVRVTTETNNAAPVAEATGTGNGSGVKPESALAFLKVSTPVKTIAHWIPATKRALSDASQIRGLIDAFLRYGLEEELEDQIVQGDGTGENFEGIMTVSGTQAQAWDTDIFITTRKARRKIRTVGRRIPTAFVLNPEDWETIELSVDNMARFYGAGPFGQTEPRLWGLPVVESEAVPVGTGLCGDFSMAVLWDREQASIQVSDSHADFFTRNLVAILAEMRAAFGILKPNAFIEIDLTA
jgi:HK97 family phage major capsid protein